MKFFLKFQMTKPINIETNTKLILDIGSREINMTHSKVLNSSLAWLAFAAGGFCAALVPAYAEISGFLYATSFSAAIICGLNYYRLRQLVANPIS